LIFTVGASPEGVEPLDGLVEVVELAAGGGLDVSVLPLLPHPAIKAASGRTRRMRMQVVRHPSGCGSM